jgi:hypothetical protein
VFCAVQHDVDVTQALEGDPANTHGRSPIARNGSDPAGAEAAGIEPVPR